MQKGFCIQKTTRSVGPFLLFLGATTPDPWYEILRLYYGNVC